MAPCEVAQILRKRLFLLKIIKRLLARSLLFLCESNLIHPTRVFFLSSFSRNSDDQYWAQIFTGLLFYAYVGIHQVRRLVFENKQTCTFPLILLCTMTKPEKSSFQKVVAFLKYRWKFRVNMSTQENNPQYIAIVKNTIQEMLLFRLNFGHKTGFFLHITICFHGLKH